MEWKVIKQRAESDMTKRMNFMAQRNGGIEGLVAVEAWLANNFDSKLLDLVKVRVSQMNGCAYCLHLHRRDAIFSENELLALSIGVAVINGWNRLAIGFRLQHPADRKRAAA
jgi:alkylhydroperoxidase family enzyme